MPSKVYTFKELAKGVPVEATVFWNDQGTSVRRAIALAFHGGGFVVGSRTMIPAEQINHLLNSNFVVVAPDYSLCPQVSMYDGPEQDAKDVYHWCKTTLPSLLAAEAVMVDRAKVVALGYSAGATLALCLGAEPDPPAAILDFYGPKYFEDEFWHSPLPSLAGIPTVEPSLLNKVFEEPLITSTGNSLEKATPGPSNSDKRSNGLPKPDLSVPRNAWLFTALKEGNHMRKIVQDGDYQRVDPTNGFSQDFPPTCFVHGDADELVVPRLSKQAARSLERLGVKTSLILVPEAPHGFDIGLTKEGSRYQYVRKGLDFLKRFAEA